jgi:hypothetical protein
MLKSKWKSGDSPAAANSSAATKNSELVRVGQVRSFRIMKLDAAEKTLELVFDPTV